MKFDLKGIAKVRTKGRTYYYAWRGGPRLSGEPGTPGFMASYNRAVEQYRTPDKNRFASVIADYKANPAYTGLRASTRAQWGKWLDRIRASFGDFSVVQFDRTDRIRVVIRLWRNAWAKTPRTADYGLQVLSRVIAHGVETGRIARNPCEGIGHLYKNDRSTIIWLDVDLAMLKATCSAEIADAVDMARFTGLRLGDLVRLSWSHVGEDAIIIFTSKSGYRREAIIPLHDELRELLARIPKRSTTILTSTRGKPWSKDGFGSSFNKSKKDAGLAGRDLHFNDLRGTAATCFYIAGFDIREIAETMGWEETSAEKIIRRYVGRDAATREKILKMRNRRGANSTKLPTKLTGYN